MYIREKYGISLVVAIALLAIIMAATLIHNGTSASVIKTQSFAISNATPISTSIAAGSSRLLPKTKANSTGAVYLTPQIFQVTGKSTIISLSTTTSTSIPTTTSISTTTPTSTTTAPTTTIPQTTGPSTTTVPPATSTTNTYYVYVANIGSNSVSVISWATDAVIATIQVPDSSPRDIVASPDGKYVYTSGLYIAKETANSTASTIQGEIVVSKISAVTDSVVGTIVLSDCGVFVNQCTGEGSPNIAISPNGQELYVLDNDTEFIARISTSSFAVQQNTAPLETFVDVPAPGTPTGPYNTNLAVTPDSRYVYVRDAYPGGGCGTGGISYDYFTVLLSATTLAEVNNNTAGSTSCYLIPGSGITIGPDDNVYEAVLGVTTLGLDFAALSKINGALNAPIALINGSPDYEVVTPDNKNLFWTQNACQPTGLPCFGPFNGTLNSVPVSSFSNASETSRPLPDTSLLGGIASTPNSTFLYTSSYSTDEVLKISTSTGQIVNRIAVGTGPWGVAIAPPPISPTTTTTTTTSTTTSTTSTTSTTTIFQSTTTTTTTTTTTSTTTIPPTTTTSSTTSTAPTTTSTVITSTTTSTSIPTTTSITTTVPPSTTSTSTTSTTTSTTAPTTTMCQPGTIIIIKKSIGGNGTFNFSSTSNASNVMCPTVSTTTTVTATTSTSTTATTSTTTSTTTMPPTTSTTSTVCPAGTTCLPSTTTTLSTTTICPTGDICPASTTTTSMITTSYPTTTIALPTTTITSSILPTTTPSTSITTTSSTTTTIIPPTTTTTILQSTASTTPTTIPPTTTTSTSITTTTSISTTTSIPTTSLSTTTTSTVPATTTSTSILYYYINSTSQGDACNSTKTFKDIGPCALQGGTPVITSVQGVAPTTTLGGCIAIAHGYYQATYDETDKDHGWTLWQCLAGSTGYVPADDDNNPCSGPNVYVNAANGGFAQYANGSTLDPFETGCTETGNLGNYNCELPFTSLHANIIADDYYTETFCGSS